MGDIFVGVYSHGRTVSVLGFPGLGLYRTARGKCDRLSLNARLKVDSGGFGGIRLPLDLPSYWPSYASGLTSRQVCDSNSDGVHRLALSEAECRRGLYGRLTWC